MLLHQTRNFNLINKYFALYNLAVIKFSSTSYMRFFSNKPSAINGVYPEKLPIHREKLINVKNIILSFNNFNTSNRNADYS